MTDGFVRIAELENEIEARLLESILDERDVAHSIRSFRDTAYDGLFQVQKGWGAVMANERHRKLILEILDDLRSGPAVFEVPPEEGDANP
ncbi:MAG: hypothetical protein ACLFOY_06955 [Desulfatibacillaceae bacterium]